MFVDVVDSILIVLIGFFPAMVRPVVGREELRPALVTKVGRTRRAFHVEAPLRPLDAVGTVRTALSVF